MRTSDERFADNLDRDHALAIAAGSIFNNVRISDSAGALNKRIGWKNDRGRHGGAGGGKVWVRTGYGLC